MRITDLPPLLRPRERLIAQGPETLADAELIAILLRTGSGGQSAIDLARQLLERFGSLGALLRAEPDELQGMRGLGDTKRATLLSVNVLLRRALEEELQQGCLLNSPQAVSRYLQHRFAWMKTECFVGLFIDMQGQLIEAANLATGTLDRVNIYPREVVRLALKHNAAAVIFAHNHPGGRAQPSALDKALTAKLKQAMDCIEVKLLDHLIVAGKQTWSFHAHGLC
jgi:DNA repair protein RadC